VAERFHRTFNKKSSATYKAREAGAALSAAEYPTLFQLCFDANPQLYRSILANSFTPVQLRPVYQRFVNALNRIERVSVVTTNIDEMLEHSLNGFQVLQRSDLALAPDITASGRKFLGKLHGSVSSIETAVFKSDDYTALALDAQYLETLRHLVASSSVVFIGYGLRDKYVLEMLKTVNDLNSVFGTGPHFLISAQARPEMPQSVHLVQYGTDFHTDHRSSILSIELISRPHTETASFQHASEPETGSELTSAHLLSDFYPPGTWESGQTAQLGGDSGMFADAITGPGWTPGEMPSGTTSVHDLLVGLMCFDRVLIPLPCVGRVFDMLGEDRFRGLVFDDVIKFIHWEGYDMVICKTDHPGYGALATARVGFDGPETAGQRIRRQMKPATGREQEYEEFIDRLQRSTISVDLSGEKNFADICAGLFSSPKTRRALGMSEGTPAGYIPRWLAHPALRLVQIARVGATCKELRLGSMKLMAGTAKLAEIAFSAVVSGTLASDAASYVLSGEFGIVDQSAFVTNPTLWDAIIRFRETGAGTSFRRGILSELLRNQGAEIIPAVDSSLKQLLPLPVLQAAKRELSALLVSRGTRSLFPAIWSDAARLEGGPAQWRKVSKERLEQYLQQNEIGPYDNCPCGSYERVRFCCLPALDN
jgi:hypothetical protein